MLATAPQRPWIVLRMLSGCALTAATGLAWGGHDVFCPVAKVRQMGRGSTRHKVTVRSFPMLDGYFFVRPDERFRPGLIDTTRTRVVVLSARGAWLVVPERQIEMVRAIERARLERFDRPMSAGDTVRVIRGALEGELVRVVTIKAKRHRAVVCSERLTKPISLDTSDLEVEYA